MKRSAWEVAQGVQNAQAELLQVGREANLDAFVARHAEGKVCPACEAGDHGIDCYGVGFACGCACHKG